MAAQALEAYEAVVVDGSDPVEAWRMQGFVELGFTVQQAEHMAITRGEDGFWLYPGDVGKQLERGLPHWLVYDLLT